MKQTTNQEDIHNLIKQGEGTTTEFKENFGKEAIETAGALANTKGGHILIGVDRKGTIKGVTLTNETLKNWETTFRKYPNQCSSQRFNILPKMENK